MIRLPRYRPEDELRDAIAALTAMGCDERQLMAFAIVLLAITPEMERTQVDKLLADLAAIQRQLSRILRAADDIEAINAHPLLGLIAVRGGWGLDTHCGLAPMMTEGQQKAPELVGMLECQPSLIRSYVNHAQEEIDYLKKALHFRTGGPYRSQIKFALINYVEQSTGSPRFELISAFLEAYRYAHGDPGAEEKEFSMQALQQFYSRYRKRMQPQAGRR